MQSAWSRPGAESIHRGLGVLHNSPALTTLRWRESPASIAVVVASVAGIAAFLYPFVLPALEPVAANRARSTDAPLLFAAVTLFSLISILLTFQPGGDGSNLQQAAKSTALLGVLVSLDATLRLVPTFLGASPIFPLIMLTGAVFGAAMGFQMGALTLLLSAFLTGGIGPWLPFQMMVAGWVGLTAGWLPRTDDKRKRLLLLALLAAFWGFAYGALMNLWSWPFAAPGLQEDAGLYWNPALSAAESLQHYFKYYLATSAVYDFFRAGANVLLIMLLGPTVMATLERFRDRFTWQPWTESESGGVGE